MAAARVLYRIRKVQHTTLIPALTNAADLIPGG
jgi:hypothetical protein